MYNRALLFLLWEPWRCKKKSLTLVLCSFCCIKLIAINQKLNKERKPLWLCLHVRQGFSFISFAFTVLAWALIYEEKQLHQWKHNPVLQQSCCSLLCASTHTIDLSHKLVLPIRCDTSVRGWRVLWLWSLSEAEGETTGEKISRCVPRNQISKWRSFNLDNWHLVTLHFKARRQQMPSFV